MTFVLKYRVKKSVFFASALSFGKSLCPLALTLASENPSAVVLALKNEKSVLIDHQYVNFSSFTVFLGNIYVKKKFRAIIFTVSKMLIYKVFSICTYIKSYGNKALFICRLIPVMRTVVSLISGVLKIDFIAFVTYSTLGITIWNFVFISFGYYGTQIIIK